MCVKRVVTPVLRVLRAFELETTGISYNETEVDFGINPCVWNLLPEEGLAVFKVRHPVTANTASLRANLIIPSGRVRSTVLSDNTTMGTRNSPILDNRGTRVTGSDIAIPSDGETTSFTEHIAYFNKCSGIFRLLGVKAQDNPAAATATDSSIEQAKKVK